MNAIHIKIAGVVAEINMVCRPTDSLYRDFRTEEPSDFRVMLTEKDIDFTPVVLDPTKKAQIKAPSIMRKFADALLAYDTLLMHGAIVGVFGSSYLFTAPSRTGKTTHVRLWLQNVPGAYIVNGDKPFIKFLSGNRLPLACGSPWAGKENMYTNTMVPLKSVILMERTEDNHIKQIPFSEAFPFLLQQTYRPDNEEMMRKTLRLLQRLNGSVTFWRFQCNNYKDDCFDVAYNALVRNQS